MIQSASTPELQTEFLRRIAHKPYRYLILGDEKSLDLKSLEKIAPIRRVSTEEIFGY